MVYRRWLLLASPVVVLPLLTILAMMLWTPSYTAQATIALDQPHPSRFGEAAKAGLADELAAAKSLRLAKAVVTELKITDATESSPLSNFKAGLSGQKRSATGGQTTTEVAQTVLKNVQVTGDVAASTITFAYTSSSPERAAAVANRFAEQYLIDGRQAKLAQTDHSVETTIQTLQTQLNEAEKAYAAASAQAQTAGVGIQERGSLQKRREAMRASLVTLQANIATAEAGSPSDAQALTSPELEAARLDLAGVVSRQADFVARFGRRQPEAIRLARERAAAVQTLADTYQRAIDAMKAEAQTDENALTALSNQIDATRVAAEPAPAKALDAMKQDILTKRALLQTYLDRLNHGASQPAQVDPVGRIVFYAEASAERANRLAFAYPLSAAVFGLVVGVGLVAFSIAIDTKVRTSHDIENRLGETSIGSIPTAGSGRTTPERYLIDKPLSTFAEAFRTIRVSLQRLRVPGGVKVLAVTSSLPEEGKTTTSFCLARSLAMSDYKTVLIDCDMRRKSINDLLGREFNVGLLEVLSGATPLENALFRDEASGAYILPLSRENQAFRNIFESSAMTALLERLKSQYDFVILDCAPILPMADGRILAAKADAVLLLTKWNDTPFKAALEALSILRGMDATIAGVVLSQVDMRAQSTHGYGDANYYHKRYKNYFVD